MVEMVTQRGDAPDGTDVPQLTKATFSSALTGIVGLSLALLAVGLISGTILRHVVQLLPAWTVLVGLTLRRDWARRAALAILVLWGILMLAIWLTVAGIWPLIPGSFSTAEILLTVVIAAFCMIGGYDAARVDRRGGRKNRYWVYFGFAMFQMIAIVVSFLELLAYD